MTDTSQQKTVCGYAFRNIKTGLFAKKGLNGWDKKPNIWTKEHHIKALITSNMRMCKNYQDLASSLKEVYMDCEIIEVIIEPGRSKSMLFNLDWLDK
jgi:hypothetical protein